MRTPRFQFTIKALLIAVALIAVPLSFLRPAANGDAAIIDLFGPVQIRPDGSIEVQGGSVRIRRPSEQTQIIRADTIVVRKNGVLIYAYGNNGHNVVYAWRDAAGRLTSPGSAQAVQLNPMTGVLHLIGSDRVQMLERPRSSMH